MSSAAEMLEHMEKLALASFNMSLHLIDTQRNSVKQHGLNCRELRTSRVRALMSGFVPSALIGIHVAVHGKDAQARNWLRRLGYKPAGDGMEAQAGIVPALLRVLHKRDGTLRPVNSETEGAFLELCKYLGLPLSHQITTQDLKDNGVLLSTGLPDGFRLEPVTGNHSTFAGVLWMLGVSMIANDYFLCNCSIWPARFQHMPALASMFQPAEACYSPPCLRSGGPGPDEEPQP